MLGSVGAYHGSSLGLECIYRLHLWLCTQSYIISRAAMEKWRGLTYTPHVTVPIDFLLATYCDPPYDPNPQRYLSLARQNIQNL